MSEHSVEFPSVEVNAFRKKEPLQAEVLKNEKLFESEDEDNDARHIVLRAPGINYREGQSIGVLTPGISDKKKPHPVRLYSIASVGNDAIGQNKDHLHICVKRVVYTDAQTGEKKHGVTSNYLCDLKIGDSLQLTGPAGRNFLLPIKQNIQRPYLFFATGTGIAPFRGMLHRLLKADEPIKEDVYLFFGVKKKAELLYHNEINSYTRLPNFHYHTACSREQTHSDGKKLYLNHLIEDHKKELALFLKNPASLIYLCGLKGMEKDIFMNLAKTLDLEPDTTEFQSLISGRVFTEVY